MQWELKLIPFFFVLRSMLHFSLQSLHWRVYAHKNAVLQPPASDATQFTSSRQKRADNSYVYMCVCENIQSAMDLRICNALLHSLMHFCVPLVCIRYIHACIIYFLYHPSCTEEKFLLKFIWNLCKNFF